jgi:uncharacterized protein YjbI with pentapeptide repeats
VTGAILIGYRYGITLWDWIKLLIVPAVIAAGGLWFNAQQREREEQLASERAQDAAVQAYLDQLTQLLVTERDQDLLRMQVDDEVRQVIQARSVPLLRSVTADRRWSLIQFLSLMGLLGKDQPVVSLAGADLRGVDGHRAPLRCVHLQEANLSAADLSEADLRASNLSEADLSEADLQGANLSASILLRAELREAHLGGAHVSVANLSEANLHKANLRKADLSASNLSGVDFSEADLRGARLNLCDLRGSNLSSADLSGVEGITNEELERQAYSLKGATMPNGQQYEDWLKSKDREANGNNYGSS